jgi:hypothetical protein
VESGVKKSKAPAAKAASKAQKKQPSAKKSAALKSASATKPTKPKKASAKSPALAAAVGVAKKKASAKPKSGAGTTSTKAPKRAAATKTYSQRADFGAPVEGFFAKQPPNLRAILEELRKLVLEAAPDATSSLKWGMPVYAIDGTIMCVLGGHKSHVNLVLSGPPGTYADPAGRLTGEGKTGRRLSLTTLAELPRAEVRAWLRTAAKVARDKR